MSQAKLVYRPSPNEPLSETIVHAVADTLGIDPVDLDDRISDCIDPDALDRLFRAGEPGEPSPDGLVVFSMAGCRIEVEGNRSVSVTPCHDRSGTSGVRA
ncbi:HalOD1 output domain-containing protein [Haloarcula salina]|uniref:HalOD1 output domain-containing protein n=1 Tax=Haloarcula salina TaxID=1429914 RepID=UPI003C6F9D9E